VTAKCAFICILRWNAMWLCIQWNVQFLLCTCSSWWHVFIQWYIQYFYTHHWTFSRVISISFK
jgi:hypothetical protein